MKIRLLILCLLPAWLVAQVPAGNSIDLFPDSTLTLRIDPQAQPQASAISGEKSRSKAFFLSLLLPGLGERYVGYRLKSELFLATEAALWLGYAGFSKSYDWQRSDYVAFAAAHAGADVREKDNAYFLDMENYATIHDYNAAKLRQRNLQAYYRDVETFYWEWDTEENRRRFGDLRVNADRTHNRATLTLGLIVANHLISAIDAMWSVYRYNQGQTAATDWSLQVGDGMTQPSVRLSFSRHF